jgi:hypothetical protein
MSLPVAQREESGRYPPKPRESANLHAGPFPTGGFHAALRDGWLTSIRDIQSFARNVRSGSDSGPRITVRSGHHGV